MGKTTRKARQAPPLSADRVRTGWQGPAGTRVRLARGQDVEAANALMATTGDGVRIIPVLRTAIEDGCPASSAMLAGLGASNTNTYYDAASAAFTDWPMNEALTTVSLTLIAADEQDRTVGVLSATAPRTLINMAMNNGYAAEKATALSLFVAKIHGLAVAEHAPAARASPPPCSSGSGRSTSSSATSCCMAPTKPTVTWPPSTPAAAGLPTPPARPSPWTASLCPSGSGAGDDQCVFTRWRPRH